MAWTGIQYARKIPYSGKENLDINADSGAPSCVNGNLLLMVLWSVMLRRILRKNSTLSKKEVPWSTHDVCGGLRSRDCLCTCCISPLLAKIHTTPEPSPSPSPIFKGKTQITFFAYLFYCFILKIENKINKYKLIPSQVLIKFPGWSTAFCYSISDSGQIREEIRLREQAPKQQY